MSSNGKKKLMLLGGLRYLLPVIEAAHRLDIHVITVDYLPDNIAHKYSDEYHNVSILDKEAVLGLARSLKIDGIMSYAVDPGVVTAAYVAEQMSLQFPGSYESARILQDKALFRKFLTDNGFNVPVAKGYSDIEAALSDTGRFNWPVIVKPVDSAGSKGVSRVDNPEDLRAAIVHALDESHSGKFIIEDFLEKSYPSSDTDCFSIDGELGFCSFSNQIFDSRVSNPYTPAAYSWPSKMPESAQRELHSELQRLFSLLGLGTGLFNIETRVATNGNTYIMEVSPRAGGNRLAEMLDMACHSHLVENSVRAALGMPLIAMETPYYDGHWAEIILHADKDGIFGGLELSDSLKPSVVEKDLWVSKGDKVLNFSGANNAIGTLVLRFPNAEMMDEVLSNSQRYIAIRYE